MNLIFSTLMSSADNRLKFPFFFQAIFKIQIFNAIFEFSVKNALKWVQTSLVLVQWFLR